MPAVRRGVAPDSKVETFAALRLGINSWRWQGVLFYIRAGLGHADDWHIKVATFQHRLQRREDLLVGQIARRAEEDQGVGALCRPEDSILRRHLKLSLELTNGIPPEFSATWE